MTLVSPILIQMIDVSGLLRPLLKEVATISALDSGIAIVSCDGDLYGYSLTEILVYLFERADKTDNEIADMRAGVT